MRKQLDCSKCSEFDEDSFISELRFILFVFLKITVLCATFSRFFGSTVVFCMCVVLFLRIFTAGRGFQSISISLQLRVPCEVDGQVRSALSTSAIK